eukprot:PITA_22636
MGTLEDANQKIKVEKLVRSSVPRTGSCGRNIPMDNVVIIDDEDDDTRTSTCDVSSDNEQDDHDSCIEINSSNVIFDIELDGDDESIESDTSSNESTSSLSKQTVEQNPNAWPPGSQSTDLSDDDDDCQVVFEYGSQPSFTSMRGTQIHHKQSSSGYYRNFQDLNTDSSDCEIMETTHVPYIACHQCPEEEKLHFVGTSKGVSSESESPRELIGDHEKLKETSEFKRADEEEWTCRQLELQQRAKEVQQLRMRKRVEVEPVLEMKGRQKRRLEEIWATQKKEEQTMDLKEQFRGEITRNLRKFASNCKDMASLLRRLGIPVGGGSVGSGSIWCKLNMQRTLK